MRTAVDELMHCYAEGIREFPGINLAGANLERAKLDGANLAGANLTRANLTGASLNSASFSHASLRHADLRCANLRRANFHGADLGCAELCSADLCNADLSDADLSDAGLIATNVSAATLSRARLAHANLLFANFIESHLDGADLSGAMLRSAHFSGADFHGADLGGAILMQTNFSNVDLSTVSGLSDANHYGPSVLDLRTFPNSWALPHRFLRGCGLLDWEIENAKLYDPYLSPAATADVQCRVHELRHKRTWVFYSVFISYSHADEAFARKLHDTLQAAGVRCWLDEKQLLPGDKVHQRITEGIRHWDKVLLCASESSLKSWWVKNELETAFEKERRLSKERNGADVLALVPLNLDGALFEWDDGYREQVTSRMAADFTGWRSPNFDFEAACRS